MQRRMIFNEAIEYLSADEPIQHEIWRENSHGINGQFRHAGYETIVAAATSRLQHAAAFRIAFGNA